MHVLSISKKGGGRANPTKQVFHTHTQESYLKIKTFRAHAIPLNTIDNYIATECWLLTEY